MRVVGGGGGERRGEKTLFLSLALMTVIIQIPGNNEYGRQHPPQREKLFLRGLGGSYTRA